RPYFFFQAEDGIRDRNVTGVQTCALPILKYILDVRDFPDSPYKDLFVKDFSVIENDPEVDVVVETIGGAKVALDFTQRALKAGKSVVSSNKELVEIGRASCRERVEKGEVGDAE